MVRKLRLYFTAGIFLLAGTVLLLNKELVIGLTLLGIAGLIFLLWEFLLKDTMKQVDVLKEELKETKSENRRLVQENEDYSKRKLNISEINTILELGLFEVKTNFKRTINQELETKGKKVQFIGVINVDFIAKYGVNIKNLQVKIDKENRELSILNAEPEFLSFTQRSSTWEIAEILEFNVPFFGSEHRKTNPKLDSIANQLKDDFRLQVEKDSENGPEELKWVSEPLRKHVERALEVILGVQDYRIRFVELGSDGYQSLFEYQEGNKVKQLNSNIVNLNSH